MLQNASIQSYTTVDRLDEFQNQFEASIHPVSPATTNGRTLAGKKLASTLEVKAANPGDHPLIRQYLRSLVCCPSECEFEHSLDHPAYQAKQRHLIRHAGEIIGHVRVIPRELKFGSVAVPTSELTEFATLPEFETLECATLLLDEAMRCAAESGTVLMTSLMSYDVNPNAWTKIATGDDHVMSPRDLLSGMESFFLSESISQDWQSRYEVRPWRWVERDDMISIFDQVTALQRGILNRSDEYWHWLSSRHGYDRAFVVVENAGDCEKIVGYTFLRNDKVLELAVSEAHDQGVFSLLRRIALEALEKGNHSLNVKASSFLGNPTVDRILRHSHASKHPAGFSCNAISISRLLKSFSPEIIKTARSEGLSTGTKLGISCGTEEVTVHVLRQKIRVSRGMDARSCIQLSKGLLTKLILGDLDLLAAKKAGYIESSTRIATAIAAKLFPKRRQLRMPLDDQLSLR